VPKPHKVFADVSSKAGMGVEKKDTVDSLELSGAEDEDLERGGGPT